ncbi:MAG: sodium:calcium antiporter, partial [Candidatus Dadabacteria bacterium]
MPLLDWVLFFGGGLALYFGAEWLVRGGASLAARFGVPPVTIGLTVVAYGTSLPEVVVSGSASLQGSGGVALGNVFGSNICNVALILGLACVLRPLSINRRLVRREIPFLVGVSGLIVLMLADGMVGRAEGMTLLGLGMLFTWALFRLSDPRELREELEVDEYVVVRRTAIAGDIARVAIGCVALFLGGAWFVDGATGIARWIGISETVIGLTMVAFGTSLPELVTILIAVRRGQHDIGVGNIIGSNVFNLTIVFGSAAALVPVPFPGGGAWGDVAFSLVLPLAVMLFRGRAGR